MKTSRDWLKIGSDGGSWQPTFLRKTAPAYDDDDDDDDNVENIHVQHVLSFFKCSLWDIS